jgi:hypothetical protein
MERNRKEVEERCEMENSFITGFYCDYDCLASFASAPPSETVYASKGVLDSDALQDAIFSRSFGENLYYNEIISWS